MVLIISTRLPLIVWGVPSVPRVLPLNVIRATRILLLLSCLISLLRLGVVRLLSRCTGNSFKEIAGGLHRLFVTSRGRMGERNEGVRGALRE